MKNEANPQTEAVSMQSKLDRIIILDREEAAKEVRYTMEHCYLSDFLPGGWRGWLCCLLGAKATIRAQVLGLRDKLESDCKRRPYPVSPFSEKESES